jgi:hypothetical protein
MKPPRRLRAEMNDPFTREMLASWRSEGPSRTSRERSWAKLAAIATPAVATAVVATGSAASAIKGAGWLTAMTAKWSLVGVVTAVAVATAVVATRPSPPPPSLSRVEAPSVAARSITAAAPPPHVPATTTPEVAALEAPARPPVVSPATPAASAVARPAPVIPASVAAPAPSSAASSDPISAEVATLDGVRAALESGSPARALVMLDAFDARFPDGALSQEASVMRVKALLAAGRRDDAMTIGRRFVDAHAGAPYAAQMHQILGDRME